MHLNIQQVMQYASPIQFDRSMHVYIADKIHPTLLHARL